MNTLALILRGRPGPLLALAVTALVFALAWSVSEPSPAANTTSLVNPFATITAALEAVP